MAKSFVKVLLVNKEYTFLDHMCKHLKKYEFTPFESVNGEEALELAINNNFDVAVIDNNLSNMDPCALFNELKELQPYLQGIFLFDQENTANSLLEKCKFSPFDYILKPYDFENLIQKITAAFEHRIDLLQSLLEHSFDETNDNSKEKGFFQKLRKWYSLPSEAWNN